MKLLTIILHILVLYGLYLLGLWMKTLLSLPIPGSVIGMLLLFVLLITNIIKPIWIEDGTELLLKVMPLLFVPVTVGIINYLDLFAGSGFMLVIIVLFSTLLVMITSGMTTQWLLQRKAGSND